MVSIFVDLTGSDFTEGQVRVFQQPCLAFSGLTIHSRALCARLKNMQTNQPGPTQRAMLRQGPFVAKCLGEKPMKGSAMY